MGCGSSTVYSADDTSSATFNSSRKEEATRRRRAKLEAKKALDRACSRSMVAARDGSPLRLDYEEVRVRLNDDHFAAISADNNAMLWDALRATPMAAADALTSSTSSRWSAGCDPETGRTFFVCGDVTQWEQPVQAEDDGPYVSSLSATHQHLGDNAAIAIARLLKPTEGEYVLPALARPPPPPEEEEDGKEGEEERGVESNDPVGEPAAVLHSYDAVGAGEISIVEGTTIQVVRGPSASSAPHGDLQGGQGAQEGLNEVGESYGGDGWWFGVHADGRAGLFPARYVRLLGAGAAQEYTETTAGFDDGRDKAQQEPEASSSTIKRMITRTYSQWFSDLVPLSLGPPPLRLRELYLEHNRVGSEGSAALSRAISRPESLLEKLYLQDCRVGDPGAAAFAVALRCSGSSGKLHTLRLDRQHLDWAGGGGGAGGVGVGRLRVPQGSTGLTDRAAAVLAWGVGLAGEPPAILEELLGNLDGERQHWVNALEEARGWERGGGRGEGGGTSLRVLGLSGNKGIGDEGAAAFFCSNNNNSSNGSGSGSGSGRGGSGSGGGEKRRDEKRRDRKKHQPPSSSAFAFDELYLSGTRIGDEGAALLAQCITSPRSPLRVISLSGCRIGDVGAVAVAKALRALGKARGKEGEATGGGREGLEKLDMQGNSFSAASIALLQESTPPRSFVVLNTADGRVVGL